MRDVYKRQVENDPVPAFSVDMSIDYKKFKEEANEKIAKAVVELSRLKYGKPRQLVETETTQRSNL